MFCESKGWNVPENFINQVNSLLKLLGTWSVKTMNMCHVYNNDRDGKHVCKAGLCSTYYPLQTCGNVCGIISIVVAFIAIYDREAFENMISVSGKQYKYSYLRDVSKYDHFLRMCIVRWLFGFSSLANDLNGYRQFDDINSITVYVTKISTGDEA